MGYGDIWAARQSAIDEKRETLAKGSNKQLREFIDQAEMVSIASESLEEMSEENLKAVLVALLFKTQRLERYVSDLWALQTQHADTIQKLRKKLAEDEIDYE